MDKISLIKKILRKNPGGLTITDIVRKSRFSRTTVRNVLSTLEGARDIQFKQIGMAKLYTLVKIK